MRYKNSDRACPVTAVACFDRHVTKSLRTLLDQPDRTEIRSLNEHNELFNY